MSDMGIYEAEPSPDGGWVLATDSSLNRTNDILEEAYGLVSRMMALPLTKFTLGDVMFLMDDARRLRFCNEAQATEFRDAVREMLDRVSAPTS